MNRQLSGLGWWGRAVGGAAFLSALLAVGLLLVSGFGNATDQQVALTFLVNLVAVIGIQVFLGLSGVITFGHVGFLALGAYTSALLTTPPETKQLESFIPNAPGLVLDAHMAFIPSLGITAVVVGVIAAALGVAFARLSGPAASIATFALLLVVVDLLSNADNLTRGTKTFFGVPPEATLWGYFVLAAIAILVARLYRDSASGLRLRASKSDELGSRAVGVDIVRMRLGSWVLSAVIVAIGGAMYAHLLGAFSPRDFGLPLTFTLTVMVMVGGSTISGAVLGAALITVLTEFLRRQESGFSIGPIDIGQAFGLTTIVLGALVLLILRARPSGLIATQELDQLLGGLGGRRADGRASGRTSHQTSPTQPAPSQNERRRET